MWNLEIEGDKEFVNSVRELVVYLENSRDAHSPDFGAAEEELLQGLQEALTDYDAGMFTINTELTKLMKESLTQDDEPKKET